VFLTDCSAANGTLQVFPRIHKFGKLEHKLLSTGDCKYQLVVKQLPAIKPLTIEGATGTILVMSSHMIHQSRANKSTGDRPILIFEIERFQGFAIDEYEQLPLMLIGEMTTAERWRSRLTYSLKSDVLLARTKSLIRKTWKRS
jgi:ectoine hydroxylase-related dioxygenase (phytanoyl-CoA dioxygenase family)